MVFVLFSTKNGLLKDAHKKLSNYVNSLLLMRPTRPLSLPFILGAQSVHICKFGIFPQNIPEVHSEYPHLLFGHGVVVRTTFPPEEFSSRNFTQRHKDNIGDICSLIHCMAPHTDQPTSGHVCAF